MKGQRLQQKLKDRVSKLLKWWQLANDVHAEETIHTALWREIMADYFQIIHPTSQACERGQANDCRVFYSTCCYNRDSFGTDGRVTPDGKRCLHRDHGIGSPRVEQEPQYNSSCRCELCVENQGRRISTVLRRQRHNLGEANLQNKSRGATLLWFGQDDRKSYHDSYHETANAQLLEWWLFHPSHLRQSEATRGGTACEYPQWPEQLGSPYPYYITTDRERVKTIFIKEI